MPLTPADKAYELLQAHKRLREHALRSPALARLVRLQAEYLEENYGTDIDRMLDGYAQLELEVIRYV